MSLCKAIVVGDSGVGKTTLVRAAEGKGPSEHGGPTVGVDFATFRHGDVRLSVWDTAGQERFRAMSAAYYRGVQACIIVFDLSAAETWDSVQSWLAEMRAHTTSSSRVFVVVVGNKSDAPRAVRGDLHMDLAVRNMGAQAYYETSALLSPSAAMQIFRDICVSVTAPALETATTHARVELVPNAQQRRDAGDVGNWCCT